MRDDDRLYEAMNDRRDWAAWDYPEKEEATAMIHGLPADPIVHEHHHDTPKVSVSFKKSSTKDGGTGFDITVDEGCTAEEANRIYELALALKQRADDALRPPSLADELESSIKRMARE